MKAVLSRSSNPDKKYEVVVEKEGAKRTIQFGDKHSQDYTLYSPLERDERKRLYLLRHRARENWSDPFSAGFWSRWLLWNVPTVSASKRDITKRFGIQFTGDWICWGTSWDAEYTHGYPELALRSPFAEPWGVWGAQGVPSPPRTSFWCQPLASQRHQYLSLPSWLGVYGAFY